MDQQANFQKLTELARSPAGQQLLERLRKADPNALEALRQAAVAGQLDKAKEILTSLLEQTQAGDPAKKLEGML